MRVILLFSVLLPLVCSLHISTTSRVTYPSDIRAQFLLQEATDDSPLCPLNVTHTTWSVGPSGHIELPHNTIIHNGVRCNSNGREKVLVFYESQYYNSDLSPKSPDVSKLPDALIDVVAISGFNIDAIHAGYAQDEDFLIGFEQQPRYCDAGGNWLSDTTVFLYRPFKPFSVKNLNTQLEPGYKYMLVVPRYSSVYCLYSARVPGHPVATAAVDDDGEDVEHTAQVEQSDTPVASDEPMASPEMTLLGSETVEMGPAPANGREVEGEQTTSADELPVSADESAATADDTVTVSNEALDANDEALDASDEALDASDEPFAASDEPFATDDEPAATADEDPACFPADATVRTAHGVKRMADVQIGDFVATRDGQFSRVFAFTHRDQHVRDNFVVLHMRNGMQLAVSGGHFLYANGRVISADEVQVGDVVNTDTGTSVVQRVSNEVRVGLYNPQTESGEILVDGVLATTYTRAVDVEIAHALLTPFRAMFGAFGGELLSAVADGRGRVCFKWLQGVSGA
eukprot:TRINITY_DN355_c0_g1_i1.p1 TRINITY_DN355_c0_g1~~TRINITY_DN355_c0_g1_i1.p1  ORF type:complete len:516 (-),score=102.22 TRINITY_DN355_c0_g1_i1:1954-3501(-)